MKKNLTLPLLVLLAVTLGCSRITEMANSSRGDANSSNANTESAKAEAPSAPASSEFAPSAEPRADIEKMAERFLSVGSFRATMSGEGDVPMKNDLEFVPPDRYRIKTGTGMEMIIIGKTSYMKLGDQWQKMPMPLDSTISDMRSAFNKEGMKWFSDVKYAGDDTVKGREAYVYTYHGKGPDNVGENDSKLWVAKSSGLPLKIEAKYRSGNLKSMTIEYDYETPVTIEPPVE
jgi:outer membrane lipoprotein-sorting protein